MGEVTASKMSSLKAFKEPFGRIISEPVEDTDTTSFVAEFSLEANYPVQVTDPHDSKNRNPPSHWWQPANASPHTVTREFRLSFSSWIVSDHIIRDYAVTLPLSSMNSRYLSPSSKDRIRQPVEDVEECTWPTSTSPDYPKELQLLSPCEKCCCPAPPPKISDLMNDRDLLDLLRLKLDPTHSTIKNWKNFASRWGMSYDELTLLEHRTQGSMSHSPTQEFLMRYNQKTVTELTELCRIYQRIDVLRLLQSWIEKDWPSRWQQTH
ncbi:ectodysplasin-A receptor-associated adapter protein isoform X2 [Parambassis ranga]|uniref:Ectodysplasin-A receptor-associated adapter protein n=1 Tax=Parambassis ranga TaxID=210632 RepID=A0A6P7JXB4_9TELE|nr:ectodysplasin-A receptor-associated adapter protein isoform X2 [Parambassis ranga]